MGSFNSAPKIENADTQDDCVVVPNLTSSAELVNHCKLMRGEGLPELLNRTFYKPSVTRDVTDGMRVLELNSVSKVCSMPAAAPEHIRIFQWNILSQSLGQNNDNFICCPDEALTWESRKYLIIQEIIQNDPDIICLQEVDHFKFLQCILSTQNYEGIFYPKPDSPCLYILENNGPDGCAIFYKTNKFEIINHETRILEMWGGIQTNQVAIAVNFRLRDTNKELSVCTTHLKARHGALLAKLRNEQGKDLLKFVRSFAENRPIVMCGDFNAEPNEPVYSTIINNELLNLSSSYADMMGSETVTDNAQTDEPRNRADELALREPPFTTWKIREDGEVCHTIDYIFYSQDKFQVKNCLQFPDGPEIGKGRTPSFRYPSDHFSLLCDLEFKTDSNSSSNISVSVKPSL